MIDINITLVFQLVNFLVVYWLMNMIFFKPLLKVMDQRRERFRNLSEGFSEERQELEELESKYKKELGSAYSEASAYKQSVKDSAESEKRTILDNAQKEAEKMLDEKIKGLDQGFVELESELENEVPSLKGSMMEKILGKQAG